MQHATPGVNESLTQSWQARAALPGISIASWLTLRSINPLVNRRMISSAGADSGRRAATRRAGSGVDELYVRAGDTAAFGAGTRQDRRRPARADGHRHGPLLRPGHEDRKSVV